MVLIEREAIRRWAMAVPAIFCFSYLWEIKILSYMNVVEKKNDFMRTPTNEQWTAY